MGRRVYTYRSIAALDTHPKYAELARYPHITATGDLCRAVQERYRLSHPVMEIHALQKEIIKSWEDPDISFQQFIHISRAIRTLPVSEEEKVLHGSFLKNKAQVLNAIRLLVEADIAPADIVPACLEERLFQRIWVALEHEDDSFAQFRAAMASYLADPDRFGSTIQEIAPWMREDTIVLHGFYFITPIQERLFDMLEKCGKTLIFLCCVDETVPEVEEIWYKVLSERNRFDPPEQWSRDDPIPMRGQAFGSAFGQRPAFAPQRHISVIRYASEIDLVRDIQRLLEDEYTIFSTDRKAVDDLLKEFYPSVYQRRHLLSYPVGQYIYRLHAMWSPKDQCLRMSVDDVQACFASGWVECGGINAAKHMYTLEKLKTYVADCHTIEQWEERLSFLQEVKDTVLASFEGHLDRVPRRDRRWHRMMADPFLNLGCFDQDDAQFRELIGSLRHLIQTAKTLFNGPGEVTISEHMSKIRGILADRGEEKALLEEENAIVQELISRLQYRDMGVRTCLPGEISEAVMLVIGGGILDEDDHSIRSGTDETFIKPLYLAESAPVLGSGKVHLCLSDEDRLPGRVKPYVWPLNEDLLDRLKVPETDRRHQYLDDMRFVVENAPLANRYLFFSLLQNERVELSWIANENEKEVSPSPYIQLLERFFHVPRSRPQKPRWTAEEIGTIKESEKKLSMQVDLGRGPVTETKLDLLLCPWRYIYGYVLSEQPVYTSGFHYSFALSNLIGVLVKVSGMSKKAIGEAVLDIFPCLRGIEKQQILDHVPAVKDDAFHTIDEFSYPSARLLVHFLQKNIRAEAEDSLRRQMAESAVYEADLEGDRGRGTCMYCPYSLSCVRAEHGG